MEGELAQLGLRGPYQVHVHPVALVVDRRAHQVFEGFSPIEIRHALSGYPGAAPCWADGSLLTIATLTAAATVVVPAQSTENPGGLAGVHWLVDRLLGPGGCPWDQEQTHESLRRHLIEEAYELIDAIDAKDPEAMREELGDVLLQPVMHAQMVHRDGGYDVREVADALVDKLVRRHPHVFGDATARTSEEVLTQWDAIKGTEKGPRSALGGVPNSMPALMLAMEVSKRAARCGFEWPDLNGVWEKFEEETSELKQEIAAGDREAMARELGDLLFTVVNVARWLKLDAEDCLRTMVSRFRHRFEQMEGLAGKPLSELSPTEWESLWAIAKRS